MLGLLVALSSTYIVVPAPADVSVDAPQVSEKAAASPAPVIFYLNHDGGTYRPGSEDSRANTSSIAHKVGTIAPWAATANEWSQVMSCMTDMMSRWNVRVTDEDPGSAPHYELVIGGRPGDLGFDGNFGGVAPYRSDCSVISNAIVYTFAEVIGHNPRAVCQVAAQEVAHAFGLDHEYLCEDPMTYLSGCGQKTFQDVDAACGEYGARECYCGGDTQNSVAMFDARIGPAGTGNEAPTVAITSPVNGDIVAPGFSVSADVADNAGVERVEMRIDRQLVGVAEGSPVVFTTSPSLEPGEYAIELKAFDAAGATSSSTVTVTVDADGSIDSGTGGSPVAGGGDDPGTAAGCSAGGDAAPGAALALLALYALTRVPRRSPARRRLRR